MSPVPPTWQVSLHPWGLPCREAAGGRRRARPWRERGTPARALPRRSDACAGRSLSGSWRPPARRGRGDCLSLNVGLERWGWGRDAVLAVRVRVARWQGTAEPTIRLARSVSSQSTIKPDEYQGVIYINIYIGGMVQDIYIYI